MNSEVYKRDKRSIFTISLSRIILLIPLIIYGFYKNGIFLYSKGYVGISELFRPLIFLAIGMGIGIIVNIIYEYLIKKSKDRFLNVMFSSFHIEYGLMLASIMSLNVNLVIYSIVIFIMFLLSKFFNRINVVAISFLIIYVVSYFINPINYINPYESSKTLSLSFFDYIIGRGVGGIFSTNILLLFISLLLLHFLNNNKTNISMSALITYVLLVILGSFIIHYDIIEHLFYPSLIYAITFISTDSVTSPYTNGGMVIFGALIALFTYILSFINPIIAPYIAITIFSLLNSIIDRVFIKVSKNKGAL